MRGGADGPVGWRRGTGASEESGETGILLAAM